MTVAAEIGGMTVGEMLDRMSGRELQDWIARFALREDAERQRRLVAHNESLLKKGRR